MVKVNNPSLNSLDEIRLLVQSPIDNIHDWLVGCTIVDSGRCPMDNFISLGTKLYDKLLVRFVRR